MDKSKMPEIALGAWAWGNDGTFGGDLDVDAVRPVFDAAMAEGLTCWDTALAYGMGASEKTLGALLKGLPRDSYLVSDKLTPQCMPSFDAPASEMYERQCQLLGIDDIDIYWVHNPVDAPHWIEEVAHYFSNKDFVPAIGVSNHNLAEIKQAAEILAAHGLKLAAVQNHFSLINRSSEASGILDWCRQNDVAFFSYMVLEQGALTGVYSSENPMPDSERANVYNPLMGKLDVLNAEIAKVAADHDATPAQVAIAWAQGKGTIPLVGVTKVRHVADAAAASRLALSDDEVSSLEKLAGDLDINAIRFWEKEMA